MISQSGAGVEAVSSRRTQVRWRPKAVVQRLRQFSASAVWWVLSVGVVVALWELAAGLDLINPVILPPPHVFIAELQNQAQFLMPQVGVQRIGLHFAALTAIWASLRRVLIGLVVAFVAALITGSLAFYLTIFRNLTFPTITLLAPVAPAAWIPLAILVFGLGDSAAIFIVFVSIFFILTLATLNNMNNVDQVYINTARVLGGSRRQVLQHVIFPAILPNLFIIVRMNLFGAWMGVLGAEMVGVRTGLGAVVVVGRQMMNMNLTFLGMAMIGIVGYLLDVGLSLIQKRVLWWKSTARM